MEQDIVNALLTRLSTLVVTPTALPVAWPDVPYAPTVGQAHLRASILRADPSQVTLGTGGYTRSRGVLQVDVCMPEGSGEVKGSAVADQVIAHFKQTTLVSGLTTVRVIRRPHIAAVLKDSPWYRFIVRVPYQADLPN